jgi:transcriptional regulator with XRE-family HTH domain
MLDRHVLHIGMIWRLRRVTAGLRQQDIAGRAGITTTRLSAIERGELEPSDLDRKLIERLLPEIPAVGLAEARSRHDLAATEEMLVSCAVPASNGLQRKERSPAYSPEPTTTQEPRQ